MNIKLTDKQKIKIRNSDDIYEIMQRILLRENRIDRNREHFWTISLDTASKILNIELISIGTVNRTLVEPMEVFSVPLQKRAVKLMLIHNHPSGEVVPSEADKDLTDRLIQVGLIMNVPVLDHLIITERTFFSFADGGLMEKLAKSTKYVPPYILQQRMEKAAREKGAEDGMKTKAREMARTMKAKGYKIEEIMEITGLTRNAINRLKVEE